MTETIKLDADQLRSLLAYDSETGIFTWKVSMRGLRAGSVAGHKSKRGYITIMLDGESYPAHRLAWLYLYGLWPEDQVDHINGIRDDNRAANLRQATHKQNLENMKLRSDSSSGYRGVSYNKNARKFTAKVGHNGRQIYIGLFDTPEEAAAAASLKRLELFTHDTGRDREVIHA